MPLCRSGSTLRGPRTTSGHDDGRQWCVSCSVYGWIEDLKDSPMACRNFFWHKFCYLIIIYLNRRVSELGSKTCVRVSSPLITSYHYLKLTINVNAMNVIPSYDWLYVVCVSVRVACLCMCSCVRACHCENIKMIPTLMCVFILTLDVLNDLLNFDYCIDNVVWLFYG